LQGETLPPGLLLKQMEAGGTVTGNMTEGDAREAAAWRRTTERQHASTAAALVRAISSLSAIIAWRRLVRVS
jgi:hypothetical protein